MGDASHPSLPYQAQGAAMAVEDGAVLGLLLTKLLNCGLPTHPMERYTRITGILELYESLRKKSTEVNVLGAVQSQEFYHLPNGDIQEERDKLLSQLPDSKWLGGCKWNWGDSEYQKGLLGFDVIADSERRFDDWVHSQSDGFNRKTSSIVNESSEAHGYCNFPFGSNVNPSVSSNVPFAAECVRHATEVLKANKILILASASLARETTALDELKQALGDRYTGVKVGITPHTLWSEVLDITGETKVLEVDLIVTIGGGSLTDAAKIVTLVGPLPYNLPSALLTLDIGSRK
jgi:hypothetical protein